MKIAIVGGGIVGLTTAELMQRDSFRNADITILASDFDDTVSHVAAGIFRVSPSFCGPTEIITRYVNNNKLIILSSYYILLKVSNKLYICMCDM